MGFPPGSPCGKSGLAPLYPRHRVYLKEPKPPLRTLVFLCSMVLSYHCLGGGSREKSCEVSGWGRFSAIHFDRTQAKTENGSGLTFQWSRTVLAFSCFSQLKNKNSRNPLPYTRLLWKKYDNGCERAEPFLRMWYPIRVAKKNVSMPSSGRSHFYP